MVLQANQNIKFVCDFLSILKIVLHDSLYTEIDLANDNDVMNLKATISYVFAGEVQYARNGNLDQICQTLLAGQSTPLDTVAQFVRDYYSGMQLNIVAQEMFDYYKAVVTFNDDISK